jgi:hypothetical protein
LPVANGPATPTKEDEMTQTTAMTEQEPGLVLNEKGQCPACQRKPLVYKRQRMKFCTRCNREFDIFIGKQIENWAWRSVGPFMFLQTIATGAIANGGAIKNQEIERC